MTKGNDLDIFLELIGSLDDYNNTLTTCFKLIKRLPEEESRQFYTIKLNHFKDHPTFKPGSEVLNSSNLDFCSIIFSLLCRYLFVLLFEDEEETINDEIDYFNNSNAISTSTFLNMQ